MGGLGVWLEDLDVFAVVLGCGWKIWPRLEWFRGMTGGFGRVWVGFGEHFAYVWQIWGSAGMYLAYVWQPSDGMPWIGVGISTGQTVVSGSICHT